MLYVELSNILEILFETYTTDYDSFVVKIPALIAVDIVGGEISSDDYHYKKVINYISCGDEYQMKFTKILYAFTSFENYNKFINELIKSIFKYCHSLNNDNTTFKLYMQLITLYEVFGFDTQYLPDVLITKFKQSLYIVKNNIDELNHISNAKYYIEDAEWILDNIEPMKPLTLIEIINENNK